VSKLNFHMTDLVRPLNDLCSSVAGLPQSKDQLLFLKHARKSRG